MPLNHRKLTVCVQSRALAQCESGFVDALRQELARPNPLAVRQNETGLRQFWRGSKIRWKPFNLLKIGSLTRNAVQAKLQFEFTGRPQPYWKCSEVLPDSELTSCVDDFLPKV